MYPWLRKEVEEVHRLNSKNGWSPLPQGFALLTAQFPEKESLAIDKTAWDWTMPGWVVHVYVRMRLAGCVDVDDRYRNALWARFYYLLGPGAVYQMPSGEIRRQLSFGLQKSGGLPTLSLNGFAQRSQTLLALIRLGWQERPVEWDLGDDVLMRTNWEQEKVERFVDELARTGCIVKHAKRVREFAGFEYGSSTVTPIYPQRHKYALKHVGEQEADMLQSFFMLYSLSSEQGSKWLQEVRDRAPLDLGPHVYKMWALGLVRLSVLDGVPGLFVP